MLPHRHLHGAGQCHRERLQALRRRTGRQARRARGSSTSRSTTKSTPPKAVDNVNKLIKRDNVDVLVGTVHSGVAMAMAKVARETGTLMVPNAAPTR